MKNLVLAVIFITAGFGIGYVCAKHNLLQEAQRMLPDEIIVKFQTKTATITEN